MLRSIALALLAILAVPVHAPAAERLSGEAIERSFGKTWVMMVPRAFSPSALTPSARCAVSIA